MIYEHQLQNDVWNEKYFKRKLINYYKKGHCLGEVCRKFHVDISTTLNILKKSKIRKTQLYRIQEKQSILNDSKTFDLILESEKYHLDKFFPSVNTGEFTTSYYYYWNSKFMNQQKKRKKCMHHTRHIRCATCGQILADASNIDIEPKTEIYINNIKVA